MKQDSAPETGNSSVYELQDTEGHDEGWMSLLRSLGDLYA